MIRTLDPTFLNQVANDPSVRPWVAVGDEPIDIGPAVQNPLNIALQGEHGGFVLTRNEPGVYECHSLFLASGRGAEPVDLAKSGLRYIFAATDCVEIVTKVPQANKGAVGLARAFGFKERFVRKDAWPAPDGVCDISYQGLTVDQWAMRDPQALAAGRWFHEQLDKATSPLSLPEHPADEAHDYAAGASVLMARAGNGVKAVWFYNRWARLAGYTTISLLSEHPTVMDMSDTGVRLVVEVRGDDMEVLLCQSG